MYMFINLLVRFWDFLYFIITLFFYFFHFLKSKFFLFLIFFFCFVQCKSAKTPHPCFCISYPRDNLTIEIFYSNKTRIITFIKANQQHCGKLYLKRVLDLMSEVAFLYEIDYQNSNIKFYNKQFFNTQHSNFIIHNIIIKQRFNHDFREAWLLKQHM